MQVLLTGGSGFLGRHIIWALLERHDVEKIRVLDLLPLDPNFINECNLHEDNFEMVVGDITDKKCVTNATRGINIVIHAASIIVTNPSTIIGINVDEVNVKGTINLVRASIENGVDVFVYTGTTEMGRSWRPVNNANEEEIDRRVLEGEGSILSTYSSTKWLAEQYVLQANGIPLPRYSDDDQQRCLRTVSIRPSAIYGEFDIRFIPQIIHRASGFFGLMPILGSRTVETTKVYAGNVAWAHICAIDKLVNPTAASQVGGNAFIVNDDTPADNSILYFRSVLEAHKIKILPLCVSFYVLIFSYFLAKIVIGILRPFTNIALPVNADELVIFCVPNRYNASKIRKFLDYVPKYSPEDAFRRSHKYYADLKGA